MLDCGLTHDGACKPCKEPAERDVHRERGCRGNGRYVGRLGQSGAERWLTGRMPLASGCEGWRQAAGPPPPLSTWQVGVSDRRGRAPGGGGGR
eukprot:3815628-Pyramimonas_sp.AAC.1